MTRLRLFLTITLLWSSHALLLAQQVALEPDSVSKNYEQELPRIPPTEPTDSIARMQVAEGFQVELAAHEPLISDPIAMCFDEWGRLFVVCMRGYSEHRDDQLGVIRRLEDTDGDGVFDRGTDYVSGLAWPTAVASYDGGVFVGAPPHLYYCKDTDDDGVADEQTTILTGFGHQNVQGMMNSFRWGLDNRLYIAAGTNGGNVQSPGQENAPLSLRGKDLSLDPRTRSFRAESGGAQHGQTFDNWGNRFVCSNSDHLQWIEFEQRHLARNRMLTGYRGRRSVAVDGAAAEVYRTSSVEPWRIVRTRLRVKGMVGGPVEGGGRASGYFTSASGVTVYSGDLFPTPFLQDPHVFIGDVGSNLVHVKRIQTKGLDKHGERISQEPTEFLTSTDNWFRPVQFANGPDGALYVIDMYRETIEHPLSLPPMIKQHLDLNSGRDRGRIYRVVPARRQLATAPLPGKASDEALVAMLDHANGWHRETAARLILQRADQDADRHEKLVGNLREAILTAAPQARIRAIYLLQSLNRLDEGLLISALSDSHVQVRRHALKLIDAGANMGEATTRQLLALASDPHVWVRYQLALTAGHLDWAVRGPILAQLAQQASSSKMQFAILSSMSEERFELLSELLANETSNSSWQPMAVEIARQIGRQKSRAGETLRLLDRQPAAVREPLTASLLLGTQLRGDQLQSFLTSHNLADVNARLQQLATQARQSATDGKVDVAQRLRAIKRLSLFPFPAVQPTATQLLAAQQPGRVREATVELLGTYRSADVADLLLEHGASLSPQGRRTAISLLTSRASWAKRMLEQFSAASMVPQWLAAGDRERLRKHRDPEVAKLAQELLAVDRDRQQIVTRFQSLLTGEGSVERGKSMFQKTCASCHRLDNQGAQVGPDLTPLRNRGAAFMLTNILDPNREVDPRYEAYNAVTADGKVYSGILRNDAPQTVELLLADGKVAAVDRADLEILQATGKSLMPEGLEQDLGEQGRGRCDCVFDANGCPVTRAT